MGSFVSYLRVSTQRQGQSGLGIEAQRVAVAQHIASNNGVHLGEYIEIETGKGAKALSKRPELAAAIRMAQSKGATLLIAKLDRLARNVRFVSELMEGNVPFVACDMPQANRFVLHVMAAVAEHEAAAVSARTKEALAAARARGVRLGTKARENARAKNEMRRWEAELYAHKLRPHLEEMLAEDLSLSQMGSTLALRGFRPVGGGDWHRTQVARVIYRLGLRKPYRDCT